MSGRDNHSPKQKECCTEQCHLTSVSTVAGALLFGVVAGSVGLGFALCSVCCTDKFPSALALGLAIGIPGGFGSVIGGGFCFLACHKKEPSWNDIPERIPLVVVRQPAPEAAIQPAPEAAIQPAEDEDSEPPFGL